MFQAGWFLYGSEVQQPKRSGGVAQTAERSAERGWLLRRGVAKVMDGNEGVVSPNTWISGLLPWEKCWW